MGLVVAILIGLLLGAIVYFILALLGLPYIICIIAAILVFILCMFGGPGYYNGRRAP